MLVRVTVGQISTILFYKCNRGIYEVFIYWTTRHRERVKSQRREYRDSKWNGTFVRAGPRRTREVQVRSRNFFVSEDGEEVLAGS